MKSKRIVEMSHTDAAGVLFFPRVYEIAHSVYEECFSKCGLSIATVLSDRDYILPIVASEATYKAPMVLGQAFEVRINLKSQTDSSYTLVYEFTANNLLLCQVQTVHVALDRDKKKKLALPLEIIQVLKSLSQSV